MKRSRDKRSHRETSHLDPGELDDVPKPTAWRMGFAGGAIVGSTDRIGAYVTDRHYNATSLARTIYGQLGIDADHELYTADRRPVKIVPEDAPQIREALA